MDLVGNLPFFVVKRDQKYRRILKIQPFEQKVSRTVRRGSERPVAQTVAPGGECR